MFLIISSIAFGVGGGIALPAFLALAVIEGKKENVLGSVMSLLIIAHSLGMLTGFLMAGLTMDYLELVYAFPVGAAIMGIRIVGYGWSWLKR